MNLDEKHLKSAAKGRAAAAWLYAFAAFAALSAQTAEASLRQDVEFLMRHAPPQDAAVPGDYATNNCLLAAEARRRAPVVAVAGGDALLAHVGEPAGSLGRARRRRDGGLSAGRAFPAAGGDVSGSREACAAGPKETSRQAAK